ncbi:putative mitochondrial carrier [Neolecta irregularis DAH-3]|uniref:Putative mitochondrial carrier n=1 Tax=Neolecta irregularis (strain DAH-3) TaxID=1198029 RepID=A0A1U7LJV8_NEOID|nr:putative mitochondrial carrier [Neolecta irregularis DAH-3]|eukprot:OLL22918.1 putative mitochondrial carrier [Neolecta irregularis DAH-3]
MEGIRGFFRGIWVPLCSITAVRTCSFSIYANTKDRYREILAPNVPPPHVSQFTNTVAATLAGLTSGAVISVISCPFEFTKLAMQIEYLLAKAKYSSAPDFPSYPEITPKGSLETAKEIVRNRGLLGLYSGFPYHLLRDAAGTGLYFTFYESFKWALTPHDGDAGTLTFALSGGLCGVFSWLLVFPIDTYKSIRQRDILTNPPGVLITRTRPLNYKSLRRMYRGVGVSVIRSCIVNAINFTVFENMKKCIDRWSSDE